MVNFPQKLKEIDSSPVDVEAIKEIIEFSIKSMIPCPIKHNLPLFSSVVGRVRNIVEDMILWYQKSCKCDGDEAVKAVFHCLRDEFGCEFPIEQLVGEHFTNPIDETDQLTLDIISDVVFTTNAKDNTTKIVLEYRFFGVDGNLYEGKIHVNEDLLLCGRMEASVITLDRNSGLFISEVDRTVSLRKTEVDLAKKRYEKAQEIADEAKEKFNSKSIVDSLEETVSAAAVMDALRKSGANIIEVAPEPNMTTNG